MAATDPAARSRGESVHGLDQRFNNPIGNADPIALRFQAYIEKSVAARGLVATPVAPTSGADSSLYWWTQKAASAPTRGAAVTSLGLAELMQRAIASSLQIAVFSELPAIRETAVDEARGRFAPELFAEGRYTRRDEATTALFQTGGDPRLRERDRSIDFGLRTRVQSGAQITLSQRFSDLESNIITYRPDLQSRSRTTLSMVQPLLRDSGAGYNRGFESLARLETSAAELEFRRQVESHLLELTRTYWTLFLARANLVQQERAVDAVSQIARRIEGRSSVDGMALQLNRARATEAERKAGLVRAGNAVRNNEARLRALINDSALNAVDAAEIAPADAPLASALPFDLAGAVASAVAVRPEVQSALLGYRASLVREGMAASESLPQLDLVLEGSLNGGRDGTRWGPALSDAFDARSSYVLGVRFAVPLGPDERKARHDRRRIETWQQALQARTTVETVILELEITSNEYAAAWADLGRRSEALRLAVADYGVLGTRYESGMAISGGGGASDGILYLDQLLAAQDRVANAELEMAQAQATLQVATAALARSRGTFLADLGFEIVRSEGAAGAPDSGLPIFRVQKRGVAQ